MLCPELCQYIYGSDQVVYNTHSLIHLADDARRFGALDNVSCFPFENHLGTLSKLVRRPQGPVQQLVRRVGEKLGTVSREDKKDGPQQPHLCGPTLRHVPARTQYKKYRQGGKMISSSHGNNCYNVGGRVAVVKNFVETIQAGEIYAVCQFYERQECFYNYPINSTVVGIKTVSKLSEELQGVAVTDLRERMILLPLKEGQGHAALIQLHDL